MGRFHVADGLCVERTRSGGVKIMKFAPRADCFAEKGAEWEIEITDSAFASIVASVSARGETAETWSEALEWHNRKASP